MLIYFYSRMVTCRNFRFNVIRLFEIYDANCQLSTDGVDQFVDAILIRLV